MNSRKTASRATATASADQRDAPGPVPACAPTIRPSSCNRDHNWQQALERPRPSGGYRSGSDLRADQRFRRNQRHQRRCSATAPFAGATNRKPALDGLRDLLTSSGSMTTTPDHQSGPCRQAVLPGRTRRSTPCAATYPSKLDRARQTARRPAPRAPLEPQPSPEARSVCHRQRLQPERHATFYHRHGVQGRSTPAFRSHRGRAKCR